MESYREQRLRVSEVFDYDVRGGKNSAMFYWLPRDLRTFFVSKMATKIDNDIYGIFLSIKIFIITGCEDYEHICPVVTFNLFPSDFNIYPVLK